MRLDKIPEWSEWHEDRAKRLRGTIQEQTDGGSWSAVDLSSSNVTVRFRAWKPPADSLTSSDYVSNVTLSKVGDGTAGKFDDRVTITAGYSELIGEIVVADAAVTSQPTPTTYREEVIVTFSFCVSESVQPA